MARTGGRNSWIAWPAGLLCAAVVAALAWLAQPMLPVSVAWMGDMLRATTSQPVAARRRRPSRAARSRPASSTAGRSTPTICGRSSPGPPTCCSRRTRRPPPTVITALTDALAPSVRISCHWRRGRRAHDRLDARRGRGRRRRRSPTPRCAARVSLRIRRRRGRMHAHRRRRPRGAHDPRRTLALERGARVASRGVRRAPGRARVGLTRLRRSDFAAQPNTLATIAAV